MSRRPEDREIGRLDDPAPAHAVHECRVRHFEGDAIAIAELVDVREGRQVCRAVPRDVHEPVLAGHERPEVAAGPLLQGLMVGPVDDDHVDAHARDADPPDRLAAPGALAIALRQSSRRGEAIGRIRIPRMGVDMIVVNGTDHQTLKKGPGRDLRSFMPGENRLVYIAGHRTTYLAPFSHIDQLRNGDRVTIEVPYATFVYRVSGSRIVKATDLSVLRPPRHERLELQACHPRFFATHRYIAYAQLGHVERRPAAGRRSTCPSKPRVRRAGGSSRPRLRGAC